MERDQGTKEQGLGVRVFEYVILTMGHDLAIPLRIRARLAAKMRESAGTYWPVEANAWEHSRA
jgi:hypothetical protein